MHIVKTLLFLIILILLHMQRADGIDCRCECCTSENCEPSLIGSRPLWFCSEVTTCTKIQCADWYPDRCPDRSGVGRIRTICKTSNAERILPFIFANMGFMFMLLLI